MMRFRIVTTVLAVGIAGLQLTAPALAAQVVRGRTVHADSVSPIPQVLVVALNDRETVVARSLSNDAGVFSLQLPVDGVYTLQALRIGFAPTRVERVAVTKGQEIHRDLVLSDEPIQLAVVATREKDHCGLKADDGTLVLRVWQQARAALTASTLAREQRRMRARVIRFDGQTEADRSRPAIDSLNPAELVTDGAISTTPIDTMLRAGFVRATADGAFTYEIPPADVIVADDFIASHCFRVEQPPAAHPQWVGLAFAPEHPHTGYTDIAGVLWVSLPSAELQQLDFRYVNVPHMKVQACDSAIVGIGTLCSSVDSGSDAGGSVVFKRLPTGEWFAAAWTLNAGVSGGQFRRGFKSKGHGFNAQPCGAGPECYWVSNVFPRYAVMQFAVVTLSIDGIERFRNPAADSVFMRALKKRTGKRVSAVEGVIADEHGNGVSDAIVQIISLRRASYSDSAGRFSLPLLPESRSAVITVTRAGYEDVSFAIQLVRDSTRHVDLTMRAIPGRSPF